jgi:hypothetical protein
MREGFSLTYFPIPTYPFLFVIGVGEPCQLLEEPFIIEKLTHPVCLRQTPLYERGILLIHFPLTHLL